MSFKVTFISNTLTHHQLPFSEAMYNLLGEDYNFISCVPLSEERKAMGWSIPENVKYEIRTDESSQALEQANNLMLNSDVVIIGSAPDSFIKERLKNRKLTFKYSERLYKKGLSLSKLPRAVFSSYIHHGRYQKYPLYMLCASAYTASDLSIFGNYKEKAYKWGYFPEFKEYNIERLILSKRKETIKVLWCGRFIDWKHPEFALDVASRLDKENINFQLVMIGNGNEIDRIKNMAKSMNLKNPIQFLGAMSPHDVRKQMEEANIFLFTSNFNEGWGAVLNESMNSGCAVVASHAIGAVPFLVIDGENGFIYKNGNVNDLCEKVVTLAKNKELREKLGRNAYLTIKSNWNAEIAAQRFITLSKNILDMKPIKYNDGPCSNAEIINNDWF